MTGPIGGILPPGVVLTGAAGPLTGQPQPLANVAVISLPGPLGTVARPVLLQGVVVAAPDGQGVVRLQTGLGDIVLKTALPLLEGKALLLQLPIGQPPQTATLLTPGTNLPTGAIPLPGNQALQAPAPGVTISPATNLPTAAITPTATPNITLGPAIAGATVPTLFYPADAFGKLASPPAAPVTDLPDIPLPGPSFSLPNLASSLGKNLFSRSTPLPVTPPVASAIITPPPMTGATTGDITPNSVPVNTAVPGFSTTPVTSATPGTGQVTIIQITTPQEEIPLPGQQQGVPQRVIGTVIQQTPQGQPIIKTDQQILVLQTTDSPVLGSKLVLDIHQPAQTQPVAPKAIAPDLLTDWPSLEEAANTLANTAPAQAALLRGTVPQIGTGFSSQLVFMLTALRLGDVRALMGEAPLKTLERIGKKDLVEALKSDFKALSEPTFEPVEPGWRGHSLPIQHQGELTMIHFFTRPPPPEPDEQGQSGTENHDKATRFLVDIELSHLGPIQIEGRAAPKRVDVLLRTRQMIPTAMQQELRDVFSTVLDRQQIQGGLTFQGAGEGWLALMPRRHPHGSPPYIA